MSWIAVVYERDSAQTPGKIELGKPQPRGDGLVAAEVSFEGADVGPVVGTGTSELEALTQALRLGTAALDSFRTGGGRVLYDTHGFGLQPFDQPIEHFFQMELRQLGLPEESNDAEIVEGPTPEATGYVVIKVRVGERVFRALSCPLGHGADIGDADLPTQDRVMRAVHRFMGEHQSEAPGWYREAAKLRRLAGNGGGVIDDCDDWRVVTELDRDSAFTAVLEHVFANREESAALGIDVRLFEGLYR